MLQKTNDTHDNHDLSWWDSPTGLLNLRAWPSPALNMQWNMSLEYHTGVVYATRFLGNFRHLCYACKFKSPTGSGRVHPPLVQGCGHRTSALEMMRWDSSRPRHEHEDGWCHSGVRGVRRPAPPPPHAPRPAPHRAHLAHHTGVTDPFFLHHDDAMFANSLSDFFFWRDSTISVPHTQCKSATQYTISGIKLYVNYQYNYEV